MEIQSIPLNLVVPSPMNPRKTFDEAELKELASNIEKQGLLQPITIRPLADGKVYTVKDGVADFYPAYQIVCGERRYRAFYTLFTKYNEKNLTDSEGYPVNPYAEILAIVREMSDEEAFDAMITENLQRKDVDPIEEAFAFGQLIERGKTPEEIAVRFGKSIRFIQERVKLNTLIPELKKAVKDDKMPIVSAQIICKLSEDDQKQFYNDYGQNESYAKTTVQGYVDRHFMTLDKAVWNQTEDPSDKDFEGGCDRKCGECLYNSSNHGCLFYEMKSENGGRCTNRSGFNNKTYAFMLKEVERYADRLVRKDAPLEHGKIVVALRTMTYEPESSVEFKSKLKQEIAERGYQVVDPVEAFKHKCYYDNEDERTLEMIKTGEVYHVLSLFSYDRPEIEHQYWYVKQEARADESGSHLPVNVSRKLTDIQNAKRSFGSTMTTEVAKTMAKVSEPTNVPLTRIEKKAFCLLVLQSNFKLRRFFQLGVASYRDEDYKIFEEHPDMFDRCVRAFLQERISLGHNPELKQAEPIMDDLGNLWCEKEYQKTKESVQAKHDRKIAKLTAELEELGYDEEGNPIPKKEAIQKAQTMIEQFKAMKEKHPDAILLSRVGDFYEAFDKDAEDCAEILGITLTKRKIEDEMISLAGFPHHALDGYLPKISRTGRRVALCEQPEDPELQPKR